MNNKKEIIEALKAVGIVDDPIACGKKSNGEESKQTFAQAIMSEQLNECRSEFEKWAKRQSIPGQRTVDGETYTTVTMRNAWDAWQAAWNRRAVPEGWQIVPIEPTQEMIEAGEMTPSRAFHETRVAGIYRAMLAAAPKAKGNE